VQPGAMDFGEQFAILTGMFEDAHAIAVEGQAHNLSQDERFVLVQLLRQHVCQMTDRLLQVECNL